MKKTNLALLLLTVSALPARAQYAGNNALSFNGTNQFVAVPARALSNRSFTVETWLRRDTTNRWDFFLTQGTNVNRNGLHIGFRSNNLFTLGFYGNDLDYTTPFTDTNWHHWAVTYDPVSRVRRIYLDGNVVAEDLPTTAYQGSGPLRLASMPFAPISFFRGALDELRIWTIARSPAEIRANRNRMLTGTEPDLALYYRFDATNGAVVANLAAATGAAWNGSLSNNPASGAGAPILTVPVAVTLPASIRSPTSVVLIGTVNPGAGATSYYFQYGTTTNHNRFTVTNTLVAGTVTSSVTNLLTGLSPATLYHVQLVASNEAGTSTGADLSFTTPSPGTQLELWGTNDFIIADANALVVLNPDFTFKAAQSTCGTICGNRFGSLDWFANGDLLASYREIGGGVRALRYNRNGAQVRFYSPSPSLNAPCDTKVSFNQQDIIVGNPIGFAPSVQRYALNSGAALESTGLQGHGGVALVPRTNGTRELWLAAEGEVGGIRIFPMNASGQIQTNQMVYANLAVSAASVTMTYDPATRRVLFSNYSDGEILAMDVETRTVVKAYTVPVAQRPPGLVFTGITAGPNGTMVAVESFDHYTFNGARRVGLDVWDADGSNYRFINLDGLPGYDLVNTSMGVAPINIVWAGNWIPPTVSNVTVANGSFSGAVSGMAGVNYLVQAATNLAAPVWRSIATNAAPFQFNDPATLPARFYRAVPQ